MSDELAKIEKKETPVLAINLIDPKPKEYSVDQDLQKIEAQYNQIMNVQEPKPEPEEIEAPPITPSNNADSPLDQFINSLRNGSRMYTLEGCRACDSAKKKLARALAEQLLEVVHCNPFGTDEEKQNCQMARKIDGFDGFPLIVDDQGKKLL